MVEESKRLFTIKKIVDYLDKQEFDQQTQSNILSRALAEVVKRARDKRLKRKEDD